jgi:hypothetical protein
MQVGGKREAGAAAGLKGREKEPVAAGLSALYGIRKQVEAQTPLADIRQACAGPLDRLVTFAGRDRDVNLLARLHTVLSILKGEKDAPGLRERLLEQLGQVERLLQGRAERSSSAAPGLIAEPPAPEPASIRTPPSAERRCEDLLRSFPAIGDAQITVLKARGLLETERLLETDALDLARVTGLSPQTAFEVKDHLRRRVDQQTREEVARRVAELNRINEQLSAEGDRVATANQTLLRSNKQLKDLYAAVSEQYDREVGDFKALQSRVVSARLESNRLSTEINFLKEAHQKLLELVEDKHRVLDDLFRRFAGLRSSFEFVSGETGFAQDVMAYVEGLLNKAFVQKKSLQDKIASSEESMERLFSEFNKIVQKGKTDFYRNL